MGGSEAKCAALGGWAAACSRPEAANPHSRRQPGRQNGIKCQALASLALQRPGRFVIKLDLALAGVRWLPEQTDAAHAPGAGSRNLRRCWSLQTCHRQNPPGKCEVRLVVRNFNHGWRGRLQEQDVHSCTPQPRAGLCPSRARGPVGDRGVSRPRRQHVTACVGNRARRVSSVALHYVQASPSGPINFETHYSRPARQCASESRV